MRELVHTLELSKTVRTEIVQLWNREYPIELNYNSQTEFDTYLEGLTEQTHVLVLDESNKIIGWYFDFIRENRRWFAIILDSRTHRQGIGTEILNLAKRNNAELNGWVIDIDNYKKSNGEVYESPLKFYVKNEFVVLAENRLKHDEISAVNIRWEK